MRTHTGALAIPSFLLIVLLCIYGSACANTNAKSANISLSAPFYAITDTIPADTLKQDTTLHVRSSKDELDAPVEYEAADSTIYDVANQKVLLYNNAEVRYKDITLQAYYIEFDWKNNVVKAFGKEDSVTHKKTGEPVFMQGTESYEAHTIMFNFKTKKGKITDLYTEQGGGFTHSSDVKKSPDNSYYAKGNAFTTCEYKEHPDFYIRSSKMKVIPDKVIVSGPANLVVADVPTPLFLPFAIFPIHKDRTSGILLPEYGQREDLGFFLSNGGYYFALSDNVDMAVRGDIYSRGSWRLNLTSNYKKRYKYGGNINLNYGRTRTFDTELKESTRNDFSVRWGFTQDPKSTPKSRFGANVNFATSKYNRTYAYEADDYLNNTYQSSISYQRTLNDKMNFSLNLDHSQSTQTHLVNLGLPTFSFNVARINPFKSGISTGAPKWYEKIGFSWNVNARNSLQQYDSLLFQPGTLQRFSNGLKHSIPVSTSFNVLKYLNISPGFNFDQVMYLQSIRKTWNPETQQVETDTVKGFVTGVNFNTSINLNTKVFGIVNFKQGKLKAIRHVLSPTVGLQYQPDFGAASWGYYKDVQVDAVGTTLPYSIFEKGTYQGPPNGKFGGINFGFDNNLEMKVFSKKDTVNHTKKIKLLESFAIRSAYNLAVDTLRLSPISISARTTLFDRLNINYSSTYDPYITDTFGRRLNQFELDVNNRLARLTQANISVGGSLKSPTKTKRTTSVGSEAEREMIYNNPDEYVDFNVPWSLSANYTLSLRRIKVNAEDSLTFTQTLNFNFDVNVSKNWKLSGSMSYDFRNKDFSYSTIEIYRDLHCWQMSIRWVPFGVRQGYFLSLNVKSAVLQDLKLNKKSESWGQF